MQCTTGAAPLGTLSGPELVVAARARGICLTTYDITRAETGRGAVDSEVIARYEKLLDLRAGQISVPLRSAARIAPTAIGASALLRMRTVPHAVVARSRVVNDFYDQDRRDAPATAYDWLQLADALTGSKECLLPDALVRGWVRRLMDECMRPVDAAYHPRLEALSALAADDRFAAHIIESAKELTAVPGASGGREAWAVVGDVRSADAISSLVADLPDVPYERFDLYSIALSMPTHVGALSSEQEQAVARELDRRVSTWTIYSYEPLAQLAAELPAPLAEPILANESRGRVGVAQRRWRVAARAPLGAYQPLCTYSPPPRSRHRHAGGSGNNPRDAVSSPTKSPLSTSGQRSVRAGRPSAQRRCGHRGPLQRPVGTVVCF